MNPHPILLTNARIITMDRTEAPGDAILLSGGRIARLGSRESLAREADPDMERIDLRGATVIPGFNDNHIHSIIMGDRMSALSLRGLSEQEIIEALAQKFRDAAPGTVLYGFGWDYPTAPRPHRKLLDEAFPRNPVYLPQFSGHGAWVNTLMLERMGIRREKDLWQGRNVGEVVTDSYGQPTGILREAFGNPFVRSIFYRRWNSTPVIRTSLEAALAVFAREGITTVQDNTWFPRAVPVLRSLHREGKLSCRFSCWRYGMMPALAWRMTLHRHNRAWFHRGPWKFMADGAFSSHSGWLFEPYADEPGTCGAGMSAERIAELIGPQAARRIQTAIHAIGDRSVAAVCDAAEILTDRYPWFPDLRTRIEHMQLVRKQDLARIRRLGLLAAVQPAALISPAKDLLLLGKERAGRAYPYRSILEEGIPLSFGSDFPGEDIYSPMEGISLAVNREGPERLSVLEALAAYTAGSAFAEGKEKEKGTITVGKAADLAVLSEDPLKARSEALGSIRVRMTIAGGKVVYRSDGEGGAQATGSRQI